MKSQFRDGRHVPGVETVPPVAAKFVFGLKRLLWRARAELPPAAAKCGSIMVATLQFARHCHIR
jgi:hypothetical protein